MKRFFDWLEETIVAVAPRARRRFAIHVLFWTVIAMFFNDLLYLVNIIDEAMLIFITLNLSWLALTVTAADLVATTDVREEAT